MRRLVEEPHEVGRVRLPVGALRAVVEPTSRDDHEAERVREPPLRDERVLGACETPVHEQEPGARSELRRAGRSGRSSHAKIVEDLL